MLEEKTMTRLWADSALTTATSSQLQEIFRIHGASILNHQKKTLRLVNLLMSMFVLLLLSLEVFTS